MTVLCAVGVAAAGAPAGASATGNGSRFIFPGNLLVSESFRTVRAARFGEVLRGVSFTPGSR